MFPLLQDPTVFQELKEVLVEYVKLNIPNVDVIVGLESRGFIFGAVLAAELKLGFIPIRKPGKLPGEISSQAFVLEYGTDTFEMQNCGLVKNQRVLLIDDLLATGGSLSAASQLVKKVGGEVAGCLVVMELDDLEGRKKLDVPVHTIMHF